MSYVSSQATKNVTVSLGTFNLTVLSSANGTTNPAPGTYAYQSGVSAQVISLPSAGYAIDYWNATDENGTVRWYPNSGSVTDDTSIFLVMYGVRSVQAVFKYVAIPTTLTITAPDTATTTTAFTISGKLSVTSTGTGIGSKTIALSYGSTAIGNVTTDINGNYSATATIGATGTFILKAQFTGSLGYASSSAQSNLTTITGELPSWLMPLGAVIGLSVVAYAVYKLTRKRKHK